MTTPEAAPDKVSIRRIAGASLIGTTIEFYDFYIFATASALVFSKIFFPTYDSFTGTLASFLTLAVAFFARPFGGIIFGHFGDRVGRKTMLVTSLLIMGVATVVIGLLPTYAQIGVWAPILLVVVRVFQGIGVGGEFGGAVLMATEHAPRKLKAFYGSWPLVGISVGLVLATGFFYLVQLLPDDQFMSWGWRIPFLASSLLIVIGLYIRMTLPESPDFEEVKQDKSRVKFPVVTVIRTSWRRVLIGFCTMAVTNVFYYIAVVFVLSYRQNEGVTRGFMLLAVCLASVLMAAGLLVSALLADRFGPSRIIAIGSVLTILAAFPFFWMIDSRNPVLILLALGLVCGVCVSLTYAPVSAFLAGLFEPNVRYSGISVSYQASGALISGFVPIIALLLLEWAGSSWAISVYIIVAAAVSLTAVLIAARSETRTTDPKEVDHKPVLDSARTT
ncbi:MFS transporter [Rhodococcoides yunnanense]|uniref:MFS transporter n=1 Tax=Rhodococcoides yunnanense TaxID=278209 RepID=UPI0009341415|nr:MFS transporter [Rhodococcus yunnanensis]